MKEEIKSIEILMIDDDPQDIEITKEIMEQSKIKIRFNEVNNGEEGLAYLRKSGKYINVKTPDLVFLDLNMPKMNGEVFLSEMKKDNQIKNIPVVILTTSESEEDVVKTYNLGASCFVTKPVGLDQFKKVVKAVDNFWFTVVKYPPK